MEADTHTNVKASAVDDAIQTADMVKEKVKAIGLKLATLNYLRVTMGTQNGVALAFLPEGSLHTPLPSDKEKKQQAPQENSKQSKLESVIMSLARRGKQFATAFQEQNLDLAMLVVSVSGIGFGIPSAKVTVLLKDVDTPQKGNSTVNTYKLFLYSFSVHDVSRLD
eukprot:m.231699 g.231699  ORF g.231699 m.231699 type:complete len:166 (-) comp16009_c0_seq7:60-557(-)